MSNPIVNHASSTLGSLTLNDVPTLAKHAVTVEYVATQISDLIGGAPGALDTLGEIAAAMAVSDGNVAGAITASIAAVADNVALALASNVANAASSSANATNIETNASGVEANSTEIANNATSIESNASEIAAVLASSSDNATNIETTNGNLTAEQSRAEAEESRLDGLISANDTSVQDALTQISDEVTARGLADEAFQITLDSHGLSHDSHVQSLSYLDLNKFDRIGGTVTGNMFITGNVNVDSAAYLYIGTKWRIEAYGAELHFRYSSDGVNWGSGIPFVSV